MDCFRSRSGSICSNSLVFSSASSLSVSGLPPPTDLSVVSVLSQQDLLDRLPESRVDDTDTDTETTSCRGEVTLTSISSSSREDHLIWLSVPKHRWGNFPITFPFFIFSVCQSVIAERDILVKTSKPDYQSPDTFFWISNREHNVLLGDFCWCLTIWDITD